MSKIIICIIMTIAAANICYSAQLELSDVIKDARNAENLKLSQAKESCKNVQPVKNEILSLKGEQSACEKINPKEIVQQTAKN